MRLAVLALLCAAGAAPSGTPERENLFRGPARCVLGYLEAVRLAGPRGPVLPTRARSLERDYVAARALIAPRTLAEIDRSAAHGREHPLAAWRDAARGVVLESFSLLEVRRAPRGTAVVTVRERWRRDGEPGLGLTMSEYLVARVGGEWRVVDRRTGEHFREGEIADGYERWFDEPGTAAQK